jgi:hypothetical protein
MSDTCSYPTDVPTPTVPPVKQDTFTENVPTDEWVNYWDINPIAHGGTFVTFDEHQDMWDIVEVTPPSVWDKAAYIVTEYVVYPDDVWCDPQDPRTAWSDDMKQILSSLGDDNMPPNVPPSLERVTFWVADFTHHIRGQPKAKEVERADPDPATYWNEIVPDRVSPSDVRGVLDEDLPE